MQFVRRVRMEALLGRLPAPEPPAEFRLVPWRDNLIEEHAAAKRDAFAEEPDSLLFPALATVRGCRALMADIARQPLFLPEATWLAVRRSDLFDEPAGGAAVGTIQGLGGGRGVGAIQNVGVVPECRGLGLGRALLVRSLYGFAQRGYRRVYLEVTADNARALTLYRSVGFRPVRTLYKPLKGETAGV
ncbi:GNAT family N-acetyltransferase [Alienimonas californiensis]|uniref:Putative acetyltransferase n=1 Tax=Alienimonas californiensis TaxID=2527989 RepID=A0A517PAQ9_9PLAN|nr:GNAT family N-acetyltransferase [Alienimonas californiensis]QDT16463.1 putative acetyltransferase [Alienimonas californiensis]